MPEILPFLEWIKMGRLEIRESAEQYQTSDLLTECQQLCILIADETRSDKDRLMDAAQGLALLLDLVERIAR